MKKIISLFIALMMLMSATVLLGISASAAEPQFTSIDMSNMTKVNQGATNWSYDSATGILKLTAPTGTKLGDCIALSDVTLETGYNYTIEVKARFAEAYTTQDTDSRAFGIVFGGQGSNPWDKNNGGKAFCAMYDRQNAKNVRLFNIGYTGSPVDSVGTAVTSEQQASTDWFTLRLTVNAVGDMKCYLDGTLMGEVSDKTNWKGGSLGVNTYGVRTSIEFKDFKIASEKAADTCTLTIHYVNADGTKVFDDYVGEYLSGSEYSVDSMPKLHYSLDVPTVSGTIIEDTEVTVVYTRTRYKLTIHYVDANGNAVASDYIEDIAYGSAYDVASPVVSGMAPDRASVASKSISKNTEITVTYSAVATNADSTPTDADAATEENGGCKGALSAAFMIPCALAGAVGMLVRRKRK